MANVLRQKRLKMLSKDPRCHWCKAFLTEETATIEHLKPRSKGGTHADENLALACADCNHARGSTDNPVKARKKIERHLNKLKREELMKSITPKPAQKTASAGYSLGQLLAEAGVS